MAKKPKRPTPINGRRKPGRSRQKAANKGRKRGHYIGEPQLQRIKAKFIAGMSKAQIAREEKHHRDTIKLIVEEKDVDSYIKKLRAQWYGRLDQILENAIKSAIHEDGRLAYKMCVDAGIIPSSGAEDQRSKIIDVTDEQAMVKRIATRMLEGAIERHKWFELPFPEADEAEAEIKAKEVEED